jgi:DNA helicase-2/ATP-dependent DNA helicase PcrA
MTIPLTMKSARGEKGEKGKTVLLKPSNSSYNPLAYKDDSGTPKEIASDIAAQILRDKATIPYRENAILVRSGKSQVRDLEAELVRLRIPYVVRGGQGLLQTEEVRDVLAYLKLAVNPKDFMALNRAISVPRRGIGEATLEKIRKVANEGHEGDLLKGCWAVNQDKMGGFVNLMRHIQSQTDPNQAVDHAIKTTRYRDYLQDKYKKDREKLVIKLENLERLALVVASLLEESEMTLADVVFQLSMDDQVKDDDTSGRVVISTIHKAKGLEWTRVFVTNLYQGSIPHQYSMGSLEEIDEERRLFYVAFTRAKDTAVLCLPTHISKRTATGWSKVPVSPSQFLTEIGIV